MQETVDGQRAIAVAAAVGATGLDTEFHRGLGLYDSTMVVVGSMIGSGIFIVSADMARNIGSPGWLLGAWVADRPADRRRRAVLRRAGGDDAARRRPVRLPARSVLAAVGISLRLDAVPGDSDRHDRRGLGRLRALLRRAGAVDCRRSLPDRADPPLDRLRAVAVDDAGGRHRDDRAADLDQHPRARVRQDHPERLHDREDRRAARADSRRPAARLESHRGRRQLRQPVVAARLRRDRAGPVGGHAPSGCSSRSASRRPARCSPPTRGTTSPSPPAR